MSHVTGASVVEGKYVYIRGLGDRYSSVQLNGSSLPNADPDKRSVPMDLFPTSLLDNIVTTKSFTPDMPGDFTGGAVNIGTKAFPDNFTLSVSTSTKFNTQSTFNDQFLTYDGGGLDWIGVDDGTREIPAALSGDAKIPDVGAAYNDGEKARQLDEYSKSFSSVMAPTTAPAPLNQSYSVALGNQVSLLDKPFGFLGTLIYSNSSSFYDNGTSARWQLTSKEASTLTNNFNLTDTQGSQQIAWGSLVTLSLKPSPTHELSVTNMYNRNSEDVARYLAGAFPRDLEEDAIYETRVLKFTERQIQSLQLAGKHHFDSLRDLRAEWSASSSSSAQEEPDLRFFTNNYVTLTNRPLRDENGEVLRDGEGNVLRGDIVDYSISPSIYPLPTRYFRDLDENNREFQLNLSLPFKQWQGINSNFKTGFLALDKQRTFHERRYEFDQDDIGYDGQPDTFFEAEKVGLTSSNGGQYRFGSYVQDATQLSSNFDGDQQIYAGYAMLKLPINTQLRLVGGTRLEATRIDVASQDSTKTAGQLSENDLLPSLNAVWEIRPGMNVRASYGRTLARPTFRELAPFASFSFVGGFTFIGNAELERTLINNYDLRWEHFGNPGELYAASVFYKDFKNPIERVILTVNGEVQFQNVEAAQVAGVEFEARHGLGFLLSQLEHFHAGGNLSLVRSEVNIDSTELKLRRALDPQADSKHSLQGQSPFLDQPRSQLRPLRHWHSCRHLLQHLRPALGGSQPRRHPGRVRGSARNPRLHLLPAVARIQDQAERQKPPRLLL